MPYTYMPIGKVTEVVTEPGGGGGGGGACGPELVFSTAETIQAFRSMIAISPRGRKPVVYLTRGDESKVQALHLNGEEAVLTGGEYWTRPVVAQNDNISRGTRLVVTGTCKVGTYCSATIICRMDNLREMCFNVRGVYDRNENFLFYQELPPEIVTGREITVRITNIVGIGVEIGKIRVEATERT